MNTALWVFIALAFGLLLFTSLQGDIPDELSWLRMEPAGSTAPAASTPGAGSLTYEGWSVKYAPETLEIIKTVGQPVQAGNTLLQPPELGILCHQGKLDIRLKTRNATTGIQTTPVVFGDVEAAWEKGKANNSFPPNPQALLQDLQRATGPIRVVVSLKDHGNQQFVLDTRGASELISRFPVACR